MNKILPILFVLCVLHSTAQDSRSPVIPEIAKKVSLYPNPATSFITVHIHKNYQSGITITVFNFLGKKISETQTVTEKTVLPLTDFARGTYIYHLIDRNGKVIDTGKFQVSK